MIVLYNHMAPRKKEPPVPGDRRETVRREIVSLLREHELTAKDISFEVGITEKQVCEHLRHIRLSLQRSGTPLVVTPARCRRCGFVFRKRERLGKPGRCPACKGESIEEPMFEVRAKV